MNILVVDDLRVFTFPDGYTVTHARSLADAAYLLSTTHYDTLYLDHDMGLEEARHLVTWLQNRYLDGNTIEIGEIYLQTSNSVEKRSMALTLTRCGYTVRQGLGVAVLDSEKTAARARICKELEQARYPYGQS